MGEIKNKIEKVIVENTSDNYTTILWVSRHPPLTSQIDFLKNHFGDIRLIQVSGIFQTAEDVVSLALKYKANVVVPVLPLSFIARLCDFSKRMNFTLLWAEMKLLHNDREEPCIEFNEDTDVIVEPNRHYRFNTFKVIREVKLVLEPLL